VSSVARVYWAVWLILGTAAFLAYEIYSLASGRPQDTLSYWVWTALHIRPGESISQWSFKDLITFLAYMAIFVGWLPWHFWYRLFR
jgi:hypothetical protein